MPRPSTAQASTRERTWHPPTLRPASASVRSDAASKASALRMEEVRKRAEELTAALPRPTTSSSSADERGVLIGAELEKLYRLRRSRPASAQSIPTTIAASREGSPVQTEAAVGASRPGSASLSGLVRWGAHGELRTSESVAATLDEQLRSAVDLQSLHDKVERAMASDEDCSTPAARYDSYRRRLLAAVDEQPTIFVLLQHVFRETDKLVTHVRREAEVGRVEIATQAMRSAIEEAARAQEVALERQQRVDDLQKVVHELTEANAAAAAQQRSLEDFLGDVRVAVASTASSSILVGQSSGLVTPSSSRSSALHLPHTKEALLPDSPGSRAFVEHIVRMGQELEVLRVENQRLADVAASTLDQHTQQSREMSELLDRANGFQTHVGHMKSTMRVMKSYIEKLEQRVFLLSDAADGSALAHLSNAGQHAKTMSFAASESLLRSVTMASLLHRGCTSFDAEHHDPQNSNADVPRDLSQIMSAVVAEFGDRAPAHLAHISVPKLNPRPFDGVGGTVAYLEEVLAAVEVNLSEQLYGAMTPFDSFMWDYFVRRAPAGSTKAACEASLTLHFMTHRFEFVSIECWLYARMSTLQLAADFVLHKRRHMAALLQRLRQLEPVNKRAKDRVPRAAFLKAVGDVLPMASASDIAALAQATVAGCAVDGVKVSDDVQFESFFEPTTQGQRVVRDTLVRLLVVCSERFIASLKAQLAEMLRDDAQKLMQRVKQQRLAAVSAEVRRMMKLGDGEVITNPGQVSIQDVQDACRVVDPFVRPNDLKRVLSTVAHDPLFLGNTENSTYASALDAHKVHIDVVEKRLRTSCFFLQTTEFSPPDYPEADTGQADMSGP